MKVTDGQVVVLVVGAGAVIWLMTRPTPDEGPLEGRGHPMWKPPRDPNVSEEDWKEQKMKRTREELVRIEHQLRELALLVKEWQVRRLAEFQKLRDAHSRGHQLPRPDVQSGLVTLLAQGEGIYRKMVHLLEEFSLLSGVDPSANRIHQNVVRPLQDDLHTLNEMLDWIHHQKEASEQLGLRQWNLQVLHFTRQGDTLVQETRNQFNTLSMDVDASQMQKTVHFQTLQKHAHIHMAGDPPSLRPRSH